MNPEAVKVKLGDPGDGTERESYGSIVQLLSRIFEKHDCSDRVAGILANNCASAEQDAATSHGLYRVPAYLSTLKSGWVDGRAKPIVADAGTGFVRVDAQNGFAQVALDDARELIARKARSSGIALLAIRNSHHLGALSLDVEPFANEGLIALSVLNTWSSVVPHGGWKAVFGTNPIAFAAPRQGQHPLVFDQATSTMSNGDVALAAREGRPVPAGTGVDSTGRPTTDPREISEGGALFAFGGHKGASISLMIEILCAALGGGNFSFEAHPPRSTGAQTPRTGQTLILINPDIGVAALPAFADRMEVLTRTLAAAGQTRLPGSRRLAARADSAENGIPIPAVTLAYLKRLAAG